MTQVKICLGFRLLKKLIFKYIFVTINKFRRIGQSHNVLNTHPTKARIELNNTMRMNLTLCNIYYKAQLINKKRLLSQNFKSCFTVFKTKTPPRLILQQSAKIAKNCFLRQVCIFKFQNTAKEHIEQKLPPDKAVYARTKTFSHGRVLI